MENICFVGKRIFINQFEKVRGPSDLHHVGFSPHHVTMDARGLLPHDFNLTLTLRQWAVCFCCTIPRSPLVRLIGGLHCSMVPGLSSATIASRSIRLDYLRHTYYSRNFAKCQSKIAYMVQEGT